MCNTQKREREKYETTRKLNYEQYFVYDKIRPLIFSIVYSGIWYCVFGSWDGIFGIWDGVFVIWDGVFGILDGIFDILDCVFVILYCVFGIATCRRNIQEDPLAQTRHRAQESGNS